ncbi:MAG: PHP domain-containing protein [Chloroflexia bacterium]
MRFFTADLHIHTVLSACAEVEMLPELIVARARELRLGLIAVTDHNSAENAEAMWTAASAGGIAFLPGMEVQTREEVHLLCLFDTLEQVRRWQGEVYARLPALRNREEVFGVQIVLDAQGNAIGRNERLLLTSTSFSLEEAVRRVQELGGLCLPAHVDRPAYSIIANLGFIPPGLGLVGVEISPLLGPREAWERFPELRSYGLVAGGDAHRLKEISARTTFQMEEATVAELARALAGEGGRGVWVDGIRSGRTP